jgi:predicted DNA-binding protein
MPKKNGRPPKPASKRYLTANFSAPPEVMDALEKANKKHNLSKSVIIRRGIELAISEMEAKPHA